MEYKFLSVFNEPLIDDTYMTSLIKNFYCYAINYYQNKFTKRTMYIYLRYIESFERFMYYQFENINNVRDIKEEHILAYKDFCIDGLKNTKRTINNKLTALKLFFKYLQENDLVLYNVVLNVTLYKIDTKEFPEVIKTSELLILFDSFRKLQYGIRDLVICKIILNLGFDISETLKLHLDAIDVENKSLTYNDNIYPLGDNLLVDIKNYLEVRNQLDKNNSSYLFLNSIGNLLSIRSFEQHFKKAIVNTNLPLKYSARYLKSTFLFNMAKVLSEDELKRISNQNKLSHYYKLLDNPINNLI